MVRLSPWWFAWPTVVGAVGAASSRCQFPAGPILEIGTTNRRYRFPIGARRFVEQWNSHGPAHHSAIGVGHVASKIEKLGALLGMRIEQVC